MRHLGFRHVTTAPAVAGGDHHIIVNVASGLHLRNLGLVLLDLLFGSGDLLTQGHISPFGCHAPLRIIQLAQIDIGFADGILFGGIGDVQLGDVGELFGFGGPRLRQVQRLGFQLVKRSHMKNLLNSFSLGFWSYSIPHPTKAQGILC